MGYVVIHAGMPKTATTTIQHALADNSEYLLEKGILYPESGRPTQPDCTFNPVHHMLFSPAASAPQAIRTPLEEPKQSFEQYVRWVEEERARWKASNVILSTEMLWNQKAFDHSALLRIKDAFPDAKIIILIYLRPVEAHISSGYAQWVIGPQMFDKSFKQHYQDMLTDGFYDYSHKVSCFAEVFGNEAIRIASLPDLGKDVLSPIKKIFPEIEDINQGSKKNVHNSWVLVFLVRYINKIKYIGMKRVRNFAVRNLKWIDSRIKRNKFFEALFHPIKNHCFENLKDSSDKELADLKNKYKGV